MKTRILYTALAAFAVSSISASAQEGERPKRELPPEILAKFDTDGDGKLSEDERKAAMVSNLMVVLCGDRDAQPVVNAGTLYQ